MRSARRNLPGVVYHCIWRFVDREWLIQDDEDRLTYMRMLGRSLEKSDWRCFAYPLMSRPFRLARLAGATPMASWSKPVHSPFARWMNERYGMLGSLFANRGKDYAIGPAKEASVVAYIHNNPVRA